MASHQGKIRWGVLGWARIARNEVIPAICRTPRATLHAVASRDEAKLAEAHTKFSPARLHKSYSELIADPDVDAVYIPLPNSLHREWTIRAAEAGKHVLCEKPIAINASQAREMIAAASASGVLLMEAFMYRYTARTRKVEEILRSGVLGEIRFIQSQFRFPLDRPGDVRRIAHLGGGSFYDVGCYPLNFAGFVMDTVTDSQAGTGPSPDSVTATAVTENGIDEVFSAILRYPSGTIAALHSGLNAQKRIRSEIVGTRASLDVPDTFFGTAGTLTLTEGDRETGIPIDASDRYGAEIEDFTSAILDRRAARFSLTESLRNMELMDRIHAASRMC